MHWNIGISGITSWTRRIPKNAEVEAVTGRDLMVEAVTGRELNVEGSQTKGRQHYRHRDQ